MRGGVRKVLWEGFGSDPRRGRVAGEGFGYRKDGLVRVTNKPCPKCRNGFGAPRPRPLARLRLHRVCLYHTMMMLPETPGSAVSDSGRDD
jgi:hypothetical protein